MPADVEAGRSTWGPDGFALFVDDTLVEAEATWGIYQRMIAAYRAEDRSQGRELMVKLIDSISAGVPKALTEIITLGRTLKTARSLLETGGFKPQLHPRLG